MVSASWGLVRPLLAVMSSRIRPAGGIQDSSLFPTTCPRNFAILTVWAQRPISDVGRCPFLRETDSLHADIEDELDADIEDELTVKSLPAALSFDVLPSPCPEPYSERVSFAASLAARPLRC